MIGLIEAFLFLSFIFLSIILHEAGHYFYFLFKIGKSPKIRIGKPLGVKKKFPFGFSILVGETDDYVGISDKHYMQLCAWGVLIGFIPVIFYSLINGGLFALMFCLYVWGCIKDIKNIIEYYKEENKYGRKDNC
jgi:hypothetical protein